MNPTTSSDGSRSSSLSLSEVVHLNVGGQRFSTSKSTLTWVPETFFTTLLSGRIASIEDETGAIFIDRDPELFRRILNYLRTKQVDLSNINPKMLLHEAEFYGIAPLVKRLAICEEMNQCPCGDVLFHGLLPAPTVYQNQSEEIPVHHKRSQATTTNSTSDKTFVLRLKSANRTARNQNETSKTSKDRSSHKKVVEVKSKVDPVRVRIIRVQQNSVVVAYMDFVCCYRLKESYGWMAGYVSPRMEATIKHVAFMSKFPTQTVEKMLAVALTNNLVYLWSLEENGEQQQSRRVGVFNLNARIDEMFSIGSQLVALSWSGKVGVWHSMTQNWQVQDVMQISCYDTAGSVLLLGCLNGCIYYIDMQKFPLRMKDNDLLITELYRDPNMDVITAISVYLTPKTTICGNWIEIAYGTSTGNVRVIVQHPETVGHGPQLFQTYSVHNSPITRVALTTNHLISVCQEYNHVRSWSVTRFRGMISTQPGGQSLASFKVLTLDTNDLSDETTDCCPGPYGEQDAEQIFVQRVLPETDTLFVRIASTGERLCRIKSVDGSAITSFYVYECEGSNRMGARPRRYLFTGMANGTVQIWDLTTAMDQYVGRSQLVNAVQVNETKTPNANVTVGNSPTPLVNMSVPALNSGSRMALGLQDPTPDELLRMIDECELSSTYHSRINEDTTNYPTASFLNIPQ
ncbi:BTB domain-containing protein [Aphelenchoides besseyi]|nr:BTB domain-containing protein [Aphelenchoides besseyi]